MNYQSYVNMASAAKTKFNKDSAVGGSFRAFRKFARAAHDALETEKGQLEEYKAELKKEFSHSVALEKIAEAEQMHFANVQTKKEALQTILNRLVNSKREAITTYTMTVPTEKQQRLINSIERRGKNISDTEWQMVIAELSGNYQASAQLLDIARKIDRVYSLPFEPEDSIAKLDNLHSRLSRIVDNIDKDPLEAGLSEAADFWSEGYDANGNPVGLFSVLYAAFDETTPAYTAGNLVELTDQEDLQARLLTARHASFSVKDIALFGEIVSTNMDIEENGLSEENINRAEQLIAMANALHNGGAVADG